MKLRNFLADNFLVLDEEFWGLNSDYEGPFMELIPDIPEEVVVKFETKEDRSKKKKKLEQEKEKEKLNASFSYNEPQVKARRTEIDLIFLLYINFNHY